MFSFTHQSHQKSTSNLHGNGHRIPKIDTCDQGLLYVPETSSLGLQKLMVLSPVSFFWGRKPIGSQRNNTFFFRKPKPGHQQQPTKTHRNNGTQIQPPRGLTFSSSNFHQGVIQRAREVGVSASQESCAALVQSHLREVGLVWLVGGKVGKGKGLKKR